MVQVKDLTERTIRDRWQEVKETEEAWDDTIQQAGVAMVKSLLESAMEEELLEQIRAAHYRRTELRRGHRNGYRYRSVLTQYGLVEQLRVPRDREGQYRPGVLERYRRRQGRVDAAVREMFLLGVSTRKVQATLMPLLGAGVSAATVSRITRSLDAEAKRFHERPLGDDYRYLFLDGIVLRVKGAAAVQRKVVLCAYGITQEGRREVIDFQIKTSESGAQWEGFLRSLHDRGLKGTALRLVATDGGAGLHQALEVVYGTVPRQRCWAHKLRNVAAKLKRSHQEPCLKEAKGIYLAETKREARQRFHAWEASWKDREPKAVRCLRDDLDDLLTFLDCPKEHWRLVRTTNMIERSFREVRRRTRPMDAFANNASVDRVIFGVLSHLNGNWKEKPLPRFIHDS